jgi:hypothetical protein
MSAHDDGYLIYRQTKIIVEQASKLIQSLDKLEWGYAEQYEEEKNNESTE